MKRNQEKKRKEALERNAKWASLSLVEQLKVLDYRLGVGEGAKKQRAKIAKKLNG